MFFSMVLFLLVPVCLFGMRPNDAQLLKWVGSYEIEEFPHEGGFVF